MHPQLWDHQCRYDCPIKKVRREFSDWDLDTDRAIEMFMLQRAGYPFAKDDLVREEWLSLAVLRDEYEAAHRMPPISFGFAGVKPAAEGE